VSAEFTLDIIHCLRYIVYISLYTFGDWVVSLICHLANKIIVTHVPGLIPTAGINME
jgi:hypothetical protein